jgi:hypothetical protein
MNNAEPGTPLDKIFAVARDKTHRGALNACMSKNSRERKELFGHPGDFLENCTQEPAFVDLRGLMLDLKVN